MFPLCRSLTGEDTRKTLKYFENFHKEFKRLKFKTGSKVFDWEIPKEWNIKDAYFEHIETGRDMLNLKKIIYILLAIQNLLIKKLIMKN